MSFSAEDVVRRLGLTPLPGSRLLSGDGRQQVVSLRLSDGKAVVVKSCSAAADGFFAAEAHGLDLLTRALSTLRLGAVRVLHHQRDCIVLQGIEPGRPKGTFWREFGEDLARLHLVGGVSGYGLDDDNFIGSRPQPNGWWQDWADFFWQCRLWPRLRQLWPRLNGGERRQVENLRARTKELLPAHPPSSLLHGDLWSGNFVVSGEGRAVLIDPAVYYGHAEADLAMTQLFGGFHADFYRGYADLLPPTPGSNARREIYNLYHLCNHWLSFGGSYRSAVLAVLSRYGR